MLARHRQSLILQAVRNDGSARVSDLTQQLGVSDMTIRRDLEVLAKDGLVEKVHGGAVLPGSHGGHEPGFEDKLVLERPEKTSIARAAANLVRPGTAIAIAAGTTTLALAQCLLDVPGLTVVTNSLRVANLFSGNHSPDVASVVLTGGMRTASDALVGPVADLTIASLHFDPLFLGCTGLDPEVGLSTPNLAEAETNRALIKVARRVVVMADHTKWGVVSLASFAPVEKIGVVVTDVMLPADAHAPLAGGVGAVRLLRAALSGLLGQSHRLFDQGLHDLRLRHGRDDLALDEDLALAVPRGHPEVRLARLARAVHHAAHHRDPERDLHPGQPRGHLFRQLVDVHLGAAAGRAGDDLQAALAHAHRLEDADTDLDLLDRRRRQRHPDRVADALREQRAERGRGLDRALERRAGLVHAEA